MPRVLQLDARDNVVIALEDLRAGETVVFADQVYTLEDDVAAKHKFVTEARNPGDPIIMYGVLVGRARQTIPRGGRIFTTNVRHDCVEFSSHRDPVAWVAPNVDRWRKMVFQGYHRADG